MPNLYLTPNNVFKGRSFDELLRPLAMYTEVYNKAEEAIGDLQAKAGVWENLANEQTDPIAYATYKRYADELRNQSKILATSKLTPSTSRDILDLRRRYASEIVPLEQAYANRKAQADEQRRAMLQNPTLLLSRRADTTSLDDYVANPQLGYEVYSGALLTQQVGTAAAALAKKLRNATETGQLDQFSKVWIQRHGYTVEEVFQAMNDPENPKSSKVLTSIVEDVVNSSGIPQWGDRNVLKQAYDYANQGLWNAVGETKAERYDDKGALMAAEDMYNARQQARQYYYSKKLMNDKAALAKKLAGNKDSGERAVPRALRNDNEVKLEHAQLQDYINKGFIKRNSDGTYVLTQAGLKEYNLNNVQKSIWGHAGPMMSGGANVNYAQPSEFHKFITKITGMNDINAGKEGHVLTGVQNKINDYLSQLDNGGVAYDIYGTTELVTQIPKSHGEEIKNQVFGEGITLHKLEYQGKDKGFTGSEISADKLKDYTPSRLTATGSGGRYGVTLVWTDEKGNTIRTEAPKGVNEHVYKNALALAITNKRYNQIVNEGRVPKEKDGDFVVDLNGNVVFEDRKLTDDELAAYAAEAEKTARAFGTISSNYVVPEKPKTIEHGAMDVFEFLMGVGQTDEE